MKSLLVVLALVLAGCVSEPVDEPEPVPVITDPSDYSYVESDGDGWHVHDYWQGQDSLPIADVEQTIEFDCTGGCSYATYTRGVNRLPAGTVIPQGTSHVNITASWSFDGEHPEPLLLLRTAADPVGRSMRQISNGETFQFNSTHDENDPPHRSLSGWAFTLEFSGTRDDAYVFSGTIQLKVEAFRGLEIPAYPPHPDHWDGQTTLTLMEDEARSGTLVQESDSAWQCMGSCDFWRHAPGDGVIVPYDATHVRLELTYGAGLPAGLELAYHGADQWTPERVAPAEEEPGKTTFIVPVSHANGDSPYAKQSLWGFRVHLAEQAAGQAVWTGGYSLSAWAEKA